MKSHHTLQIWYVVDIDHANNIYWISNLNFIFKNHENKLLSSNPSSYIKNKKAFIA